MTSPLDGRAVRIGRIVAIAGRVRDAADPLGIEARARLVDASGLSPEGVELALSECLETSASRDDVARLIRRAGEAPTTWVVASANVCTAAVRAVALAVATSRRVMVRPSRRDPVLAEMLVRELAADATFNGLGCEISIAPALLPAAGDEVHVYGRDETIAAITASIPAGVVVRGHGSGFGVAVVEADDDLEAASAAIARDVVRFDQRGCLSPRVVVAGGDAARALAIGRALARALSSWSTRVPLGRVALAEAGAIALFRRSMQALGDVEGEGGHLVAIPVGARSIVLPPPARALVVTRASPENVAGLLSYVSQFLAAIGRKIADSPLSRALARVAPGARTSDLGEMQRPPLDGPVDLRHLRR